ncbi:hypothetical protein FRC07_006400 [Ceratobasidium sp. 392]|nr:hypothetical protein FRC07_006400 [Ceratobasidium sp. 392]
MSQPVSPVLSSTHSPNQASPSIGVYRKWLQLRAGASAKLWTSFTILMTLVFVARIPWLLPNGLELNQSPGEYYHFRVPLNKALLWTHLACVLPAGLLAATQFVPRVRARAMKFHRNAGKVVNLLTFVSTVAGWGVAHVSFGGDFVTRSSIYCLGVMTLWAVVKSWIAIRRLRIDAHRAWIIRAWSYQTSVLIARLVMVVLVVYLSVARGHYYTLTCDEVAHLLNNQQLYARDYPQCQPEWHGPQVKSISIEANPGDDTELGMTAAFRSVFGPSIWISIWIHAIVTEYYLFKSRDESNRLRELSLKRQNVRRILKDKKANQQ